jgi:hypothetical protein
VSGIWHGEGVAACGGGFIARGRRRAVWWHAARRGRERALAAALRAWRPRGTGSGRAQSALSSSAARRRPACAADGWCHPWQSGSGCSGVSRRWRRACAGDVEARAQWGLDYHFPRHLAGEDIWRFSWDLFDFRRARLLVRPGS